MIADYLAALRVIDLDPAVGNPKGERLDILAKLVEAKHYPNDPPEPIAAIKFRNEQSK